MNWSTLYRSLSKNVYVSKFQVGLHLKKQKNFFVKLLEWKCSTIPMYFPCWAYLFTKRLRVPYFPLWVMEISGPTWEATKRWESLIILAFIIRPTAYFFVFCTLNSTLHLLCKEPSALVDSCHQVTFCRHHCKFFVIGNGCYIHL